MSTEPSTPLPGDPLRQADAALRAYHYQLWHTVLAWLRLGPDDLLWIEQAEDFDVTTPKTATTVQVSHSLRKVSLRDGKVREAIFNCWQLRQRIGQRSFQFRYLTRGEATVEAGEPFGANESGIKLWSSAGSNPEIATRLLDFLRRERAHFPEDFRHYLQNASLADATASLFEPLVFELGAGDTNVIRDAVNVQLAAFAERHGIMPAAAIRSRDALFERVSTTAGKSTERWLTSAHLHATLASSTAVVARPGFESFMRTAEELEPSLRALAAMASGSDIFIETPLPLPPDSISRTDVVASLRGILHPGRIVFAQASTGMGKTTLAKAIAVVEPGVWQWVSMAGLRGEAIVQRLRALAARIARDTKSSCIILDDVDVSSVAHAGLSHAFAVLAVSLTECRGKMLVTTQTSPSARVLEVCGGSPDSIFSVPRMSDQEVCELAGVLGCQEGEKRENWARLARIRGQGHPQLVRAGLLDAKYRGWPQPSLLDQAEENVGHVRAEARRLVSGLADFEKELLLRLTLITGRFRREHALTVGGQPPPVPRPGEAFDSLIGAWIEPMSGASFRVSPLLAEAATDIFDPDRIRDLHVQIAKAFVQGAVSPQEGAQAFEHAWEARHVPAIGGLVQSLFEQPREVFEAISAHVAWFVIEGLKEGDALLPDNPGASLLLRMFQARIAASVTPEFAGRVFLAWRAEIEQSQPPTARASARYLLATQALGHGEVPLSAKETVDYLGILTDLENSDPDLRAMARERITNVPQDLACELRHDSLAGLQAAMSFNRCRSIAWLDDWLTALEEAPPATRENILHAARANPWWCSMMIDAAWLDEELKQPPDWLHCLAVLRRARLLGARWQVPPLVFSSMRAATVIRDEYQHDPAQALDELDGYLATADAPHPRLLDARATVLFHLGDYTAAVAEWDRLLTRWQPETGHDCYPAFAARIRAIALARTGDFRGAAEGFADARRRLPEGYDTPQIAGFFADAGLCWWKSANYLEAFAALRNAAEAASTLPAGHGDLLAFRMRRMVGHIVSVIHNRLTGWAIDGQVEPESGMASDLTTPEALKELPVGTFDYTWALLDRVANLFDLNERISSEERTRLALSADSPVRFLLIQTEIERAFRLGELEDLPALADSIERESVLGLHILRQRFTGHTGNVPARTVGWQRKSDFSGENLFTAALVVACARRTVAQVSKAWRSSTVALAWGSPFSEWLAHAEVLQALPLEEAAAKLRDPEGLPASDAILIAVRVATDVDSAPPDSLRSQVQLVLALATGIWRPAIGHCLADLCEIAWRRHAKNAALLLSPRTTVPAILEACAAPLLGIAKAAAILLAASQSTDLRLGTEIRERLQKLRDEDLPVVRAENPFLPRTPRP